MTRLARSSLNLSTVVFGRSASQGHVGCCPQSGERKLDRLANDGQTEPALSGAVGQQKIINPRSKANPKFRRNSDYSSENLITLRSSASDSPAMRKNFSKALV